MKVSNSKILITGIFTFYFFFLPQFVFAQGLKSYTSELIGWSIVSFIPIVFIEAGAYWNLFRISYKKAIWASFIANLVSTPMIAGFLYAGPFYLVGLFAGIFHLYVWGFYLANLIAPILSFFLLILIEYLIIKKFFNEIDKIRTRQAIIKANYPTFILLALFWLKYFYYSFLV